MGKIRVLCISDTHEMHDQIDLMDADILIHAGDITMMGEPSAILAFNNWCSEILRKGKIQSIVCIAGNHDFLFERQPEYARSFMTSAIYLEDSSVERNGLNIHGTPWQPWFYNWAFNLRTEEELRKKFEKIPEKTDILICHSPPYGILDLNRSQNLCGSSSLRDIIFTRKPRLVVFGHIHESYGELQQDGIYFVNASICTFAYQPTNPPVLIELEC